ncbi:MAG: hypothetical protein KJ767_00165 [Nanoarchaeota archaeon]|nr:hypothetical protein [Nanoarchaeota archaeon]
MKRALKTGFSFGLTSGIITTLGLIVGLHSGTHSKLVIIGGIIVIAIADAFSDALGIHIAEESKHKYNQKEIWAATLSTLFTKFIFAMLFIIPVLLFELDKAIIISVIFGLIILGIFSYFIADRKRINPWHVVLEHLFIAILVIIATHYIGDWAANVFG